MEQRKLRMLTKNKQAQSRVSFQKYQLSTKPKKVQHLGDGMAVTQSRSRLRNFGDNLGHSHRRTP
jgi:hypothetical protein